MPEIRYARQFIDDMKTVRLASKRKKIRRRVEQLSEFPDLGSPNLSDYIVEKYGPDVRKLVVSPFLVVYELDRDADDIDILALVPQRAAW